MSILISTITREVVYAETVKWLAAQLEGPYSVSVDVVNTPYPIEHQRNLQVKRFLAGWHDHLLMIDYDVIPTDGTVPILLDAAVRDAQAGKKRVHVAPPWTTDGEDRKRLMAYMESDGLLYPCDPEWLADGHPVHSVDVTGMSGALLPRRLLAEDLHPPYFEMTYDEDGFLLHTEDVGFWKRVKEAGWEIIVHPELAADHLKTWRMGSLAG